MKRILLAATAALAFAAAQPTVAADAPVYRKGPAPAAAAVLNWTGCYVGGNIGGVWGKSNIIIPAYPDNFDIDMSSITAGGQLGCNWQAPGSNFVLGIEGDWSWMNLDKTQLIPTNAPEQYRTKWDWTASIRGRIGFAAANSLWYVTGGPAWAHLATAHFAFGGVASSTTVSGTHTGWTIGGGFEHAFAPNWIFGIEYLYAAYQQIRYICSTCGPVDVDLKTQTVRGRVSWKW